MAKKNKEDKIIIDAILKQRPDGKISATMPASILDDTLFLGKEFSVHPVSELAYEYDGDKFVSICKKHDFDPEWCDRLRRLINLNSGYINSSLLRSHFDISWAVCARLTEDLILEKQAALAPKDRELYNLSSD